MKKTVNTIKNFILTFDNYKMLFNSKTMKPCEKFILFTIIGKQQVSLNPVIIDYAEVRRFVPVSKKTISESIKQLKAKGLIDILASINGRLEHVEQVDDKYEMIYYSLQLDILDDQNFISLGY